MQMDVGLDTGPVIEQAKLQIGAQETASQLHDRLASLGAQTLLNCLDKSEHYEASAQSEMGHCYAEKLSKSEAQLEWSEDAILLERKVRAFNAWPVARGEVAGEALRIWMARAEPGSANQPAGQVIHADREGILISCGQGALRLLEVQRPGGRRIKASDYLNARPDLVSRQ
jgi:methionyl-tRNA formyltransferase